MCKGQVIVEYQRSDAVEKLWREFPVKGLIRKLNHQRDRVSEEG